MDYKGISAGDLASALDVQRSNISHILNGRNKPGANFIEKFLLTFPDLNARWLLTGKGKMTYEKVRNPDHEQVVEKVILLYSDGSFRSYNPENKRLR